MSAYRIGDESTREWRVEYELGPGRFENYSMSALRAEVTEGGTLLFYDQHGRVLHAIGPSGWTQVTPA